MRVALCPAVPLPETRCRVPPPETTAPATLPIPRVGDQTLPGVDPRHRHRRAAATPERVMDRLDLGGGRQVRRGLEGGHRQARGVRGAEPVAEAIDHHHGRARERGGHREAVAADVLARLRHAGRADQHRGHARLAPPARVDARQDRGAAGPGRVHVHEGREPLDRAESGARAARGRIPVAEALGDAAMPAPRSRASTSIPAGSSSARTSSSPPPACLTRLLPSSLTTSASLPCWSASSPTRPARAMIWRRASPTWLASAMANGSGARARIISTS